MFAFLYSFRRDRAVTGLRRALGCVLALAALTGCQELRRDYPQLAYSLETKRDKVINMADKRVNYLIDRADRILNGVPPEEIPGAPPVQAARYCYRSLGEIDCYTTPQPHRGQEASVKAPYYPDSVPVITVMQSEDPFYAPAESPVSYHAASPAPATPISIATFDAQDGGYVTLTPVSYPLR